MYLLIDLIIIIIIIAIFKSEVTLAFVNTMLCIRKELEDLADGRD